jgi:hypothetical protein
MPIDGGPIEQITTVPTGVAGITSGSPALSASSSTGRLAFSVFEGDGHAIYVLDAADIVALVAPPATSEAALLPGRAAPAGDVLRLLSDHARGLPTAAAAAAVPAEPYRRRLTLDFVTQPTISAGVGEFGGFVGGGMSAYFSDMLGDRLLGLSVQAGGSLADLGGEVAFVNRRRRWNWAVLGGQTPYRVGYLERANRPDEGEIAVTEVILRQTSRGGSIVAAYPFSTSARLEFSGSARALTFTRQDRVRAYSASTGRFLERRDTTTDLLDPLYLAEASAALVVDRSFFGATGPIYGERYRLEIGQSVGTLRYATALADWRRYFMPVRPLTLAVRALHLGRYGAGAEDARFVGIELGHPELVHGYGVGSIAVGECAGVAAAECDVFQSLVGSRVLVANLEARVPLKGLFTGEMEYGAVPVELAAFFDAGVAWTRETRPTFAGGTRDWVRSIGGAARVNAFGLLIVEIAASRPLDRDGRPWQWQVGVRQGF